MESIVGMNGGKKMSNTFEDWFEKFNWSFDKFNYSTYGEYCKFDLKSAYEAGQKAMLDDVIKIIGDLRSNGYISILSYENIMDDLRKRYGSEGE